MSPAAARAASGTVPRWIVLGPDGAGKSTLLDRSGIAFEATRDGTLRRLTGATMECVDLPGVLLRPEADADWRAFLRTLERRGRAPAADGVILAIGVHDLLVADNAARRALAVALRTRLDALALAIGTMLPVHVVVTKVDRVPGFARFFARLSESERQQAWGVTFEGDRVLQAPGEVCRVRFGELARGAERLASERLVAGANVAERMALVGFPAAFAQLGEPLAVLLEGVFAGGEGRDPARAPWLRSLHFTSALVGPALDAPQLARARRAFDLLSSEPTALFADAAAPGSARAGEQAHFARGLLRDVLPGDRPHAVATAAPRGAALLAGAALAVAVVLLVVGTLAFLARLEMLETVGAELRAAERLVTAGDPISRLAALETLQARLETMARPVPTTTDALSAWLPAAWLGARPDLPAALRKAWLRLAEQALLRPVLGNLERVLAALPAERAALATKRTARPVLPTTEADESGYDALKAYLMLDPANRSRLDRAWLGSALARHWSAALATTGGPVSDLAGTIERQAAFFAAQADRPDAPHGVAREDLVASARSALLAARSRGSPVEREAARLRASCESRLAPIAIADVVGPRNADLVTGRRVVGGCFTREGWERHVRPELASVSPGEVVADWVLATQAGAPPSPEAVAALRVAVERRLREETRRAWVALLRDVRLQRADQVDGMARTVARLADTQSSPSLALVRRAAESLHAAGDAGLDRLAGTRAGEDSERLDMHRRHLARVQRVLVGVESGGRGAALTTLRTAMGGEGPLHAAVTHAEGPLLADLDAELRDVLRPLFAGVLADVTGVLARRATEALEAEWQAQVHDLWAQRLAGRFPFADVDAEAAPADVARFLNPRDGALARFRTRTLGALVVRGADGTYAAQRLAGVQVRLRPELLAAFRAVEGVTLDERLRFDLRPEPTPELSETVLVIDGRTLRYRNEPQEWTAFTWPGNGPDFGASLQVVPVRAAGETVASRAGRWGFLRLLGAATIRPGERSVWQVTWRTARGVNVRYAMRVQGGVLPDRLAALRGLRLPMRVAE